MAVGEWDQRQLCSDGACIGVIGPDGTCKVCGRAAPNWGDERKRGLLDPPDEDDEDDDDLADAQDDLEAEDDGELAAASEHPAGPATPRGDWTVRQLCPDGACIGVIGPDGRCKVCGRAAPDAPADPASTSAAEAAREPAAPAADPREPCVDSSCSGHIGAGGRCEVCGKGAS